MKKTNIFFVLSLLALLGITSCEGEISQFCIEPQFKTEEVNTNTYKFTPDFEIKKDYELKYYINNELKFEPWGGDWDEYNFQHKFEPGTYEVCLKVNTPDCSEEKSSCTTITVANKCIDPSFTTEILPNIDIHVFTPAFEIKEEYELKYYVNDELKFEPWGGDWDEYKFQHKFEPGTYEVCLKVNTPDCSEEKSSCTTITVANKCIDPSFTTEILPNTDIHVFTPSFEIKEGYNLKYYVNDELKFEPWGGDWDEYKFQHKFEPGTYEVCLLVTTDNCKDGGRYCTTVTKN